MIYGSNKYDVTEEWRRLYNEQFYYLYSPKIIRVIKSRRTKVAGYVACRGERRGAYSILVRRPDGKKPPGRPRRGRENNIKHGSRGEMRSIN
jgi:hypothetical protein